MPATVESKFTPNSVYNVDGRTHPMGELAVRVIDPNPDQITHDDVARVAVEVLKIPHPSEQRTLMLSGLPSEQGAVGVFLEVDGKFLDKPSIVAKSLQAGAQHEISLSVDRFWGNEADFKRDLRKELMIEEPLPVQPARNAQPTRSARRRPVPTRPARVPSPA